MNADVRRIREKLVEWLKSRVNEAGARGVVFGVSGGVDSAVVAALAQEAFPGRCIGVWMPCYSEEQDALDAAKVADAIGIPLLTVPLDEVWDLLTTSLRQILQGQSGEATSEPAPRDDALWMADANVKPRLRLTVLQYIARAKGYLVLGATNRSELEVGYFTKAADTGVDLLPIGDLTKTQVWALARELGVPQEIIEKEPSAGLWQGQTDVAELGMTYADLDRYLTTQEATPSVKERIEKLHAASEHKRRMPPIARLESLF